MNLPTINENKKGLHQKYVVRKVVGSKRVGFFGEEKLITKAVDEGAEYFLLRLDDGCKDKKHLEACRKAILFYAEQIKEHLPELSNDLIKRYSK